MRYCVGDLGHEMLWCTSGFAEFWALTLDERKRLLEVAIEEARAINPDVVIQACTAATAAKDCLDLTRHAQESGADIVYIQTPMMEVHGGEGVLNFFRYIADRTDIALGMFNSPSSGYVLTAPKSARIAAEIPAVCATKEGAFRPANSRRAARAGARTADLGMRHDRLPGRLAARRDRLLRAAGHRRLSVRDAAAPDVHRVLEPGLGRQADRGDGLRREVPGWISSTSTWGSWFTCYPGRADYFTHWGGGVQIRGVGARPADRRLSGFASAASDLPEAAKTADPRSAYRAARADVTGVAAGLRKALPIGVQYVTYIQLSRRRSETER